MGLNSSKKSNYLCLLKSYTMKNNRLQIRILLLTLTFLFLNAKDCFGQPTFENSITNTGGAGGAVISKPTGTVLNDLLVIVLMYEKGTAETITPPAGWTVILKTNNSTDCGMVTYYKVATASEPVSYTFGILNGSKWAIGCSRISNVSVASPIDVFMGATGSGITTTAPSITTSSNNALILCFYTNKKDASYTAAVSTTERYDDPNTTEGLPSNMMSSFKMISAGSTGPRNAIASETERWVGQQVAINFVSPLPIELSEFSVRVEDNVERNVTVNWQTTSENDNDYFTIEVSQDGLSWNALKKIKGAGNSSKTIYYNYIDRNPYNRVCYYRLKQTDFNGNYSYSKIESVYFEANEKLNVLLFPNPTTDYLTIDMISSDVGECKIFNLLGENVTSKTVTRDNDNNQIAFDVSNLAIGTYIIKTKKGTLRFQKK